MGKNKLAKFADMEALSNVYQYPFARLQEEGFPFRGEWGREVFGNDHPIVLELGCGRGEYTVGMGRRFRDVNFIGIDIKGNRMWTGATTAHREGLDNVRFLRTHIELLEHFFAPSEIREIWLTFPDPQMKKVRKRLTSVRFLQVYRRLLSPQGILHLKTDSPFLYTFTRELARWNNLQILEQYDNVYEELPETSVQRSIQTYYESQWRARGLDIKYLAMSLSELLPTAQDPDVEIEPDSYRSYGRQRRSEINL